MGSSPAACRSARKLPPSVMMPCIAAIWPVSRARGPNAPYARTVMVNEWNTGFNARYSVLRCSTSVASVTRSMTIISADRLHCKRVRTTVYKKLSLPDFATARANSFCGTWKHTSRGHVLISVCECRATPLRARAYTCSHTRFLPSPSHFLTRCRHDASFNHTTLDPTVHRI